MQEKIRYLNKIFGKAKLQNNGHELMIKCPGPKCSSSKKLKMNINLKNDLYHCWVCNLKGKNLGRLIKLKRPDLVAEYFNRFKTSNFFMEELELEDPVTLPEDFSLLMMNLHDPDALAIRKYAHSRGITDTLLWKYRAGYSCEWKYSKRLIIPSFCESGNLNYWTSRAIYETNYKYINATANKTSVVFNEIDIDWKESDIFIVEGPLDLIKCPDINSTCLLGSSLDKNSLLFHKLVKNSMDVTLALDPDAWKKQLTIAEALKEFDLRVFLASPSNEDVGSMDPKDVEQLYSSRVEYKNQHLQGLHHIIDKL